MSSPLQVSTPVLLLHPPLPSLHPPLPLFHPLPPLLNCRPLALLPIWGLSSTHIWPVGYFNYLCALHLSPMMTKYCSCRPSNFDIIATATTIGTTMTPFLMMMQLTATTIYVTLARCWRRVYPKEPLFWGLSWPSIQPLLLLHVARLWDNLLSGVASSELIQTTTGGCVIPCFTIGEFCIHMNSTYVQ